MNQSEVFDDLCARFIINSPYEEHQSFERMLFQIEQAQWFYEDFYRKKYSLPKLAPKRFVELMFHHCPSLQPYSSGVETIYKDFKEYKSKVPVCGCILMNGDLSKVVMVQGYGSNTWGFPRGKINKDEQPSACALREAYEEVGYDASQNLLLDDYIDFTNRQQSVRLYLCPDVLESTVFETRTRKEIKKIAWVNVAQLPMSFEANKQPGTKMYNVPPALVSQIRSWIKKYRRKRGKGRAPASNITGVAGKVKPRIAMSQSGGDAEEEEDDALCADPNFPTDREISKAEFRERELERWNASQEDDGLDSSELQLKGDTSSWNQWEANHRMFGFVSTYNPEDYTTKLDESKSEYADRVLQAFGLKVPPGKRPSEHTVGIPPVVLASPGAGRRDTNRQANSAKGNSKPSPKPKSRAQAQSQVVAAAILQSDPSPSHSPSTTTSSTTSSTVVTRSALAAFDDD